MRKGGGLLCSSSKISKNFHFVSLTAGVGFKMLKVLMFRVLGDTAMLIPLGCPSGECTLVVAPSPEHLSMSALIPLPGIRQTGRNGAVSSRIKAIAITERPPCGVSSLGLPKTLMS